MNKERVILNELEGGLSYISIFDGEFESSLNFDSYRKEFISAFKESPEYFTDEILITINHYLETKEFTTANEVISDIEAEIVGRSFAPNIKYAFDLVGDGYEWIGLKLERQIEIVGSNIRANLLKR